MPRLKKMTGCTESMLRGISTPFRVIKMSKKLERMLVNVCLVSILIKTSAHTIKVMKPGASYTYLF